MPGTIGALLQIEASRESMACFPEDAKIKGKYARWVQVDVAPLRNLCQHLPELHRQSMIGDTSAANKVSEQHRACPQVFSENGESPTKARVDKQSNL